LVIMFLSGGALNGNLPKSLEVQVKASAPAEQK